MSLTMKKRNILYVAAFSALMGSSLVSCDSYLDTMPDNRAEVNTEDKVVRLITSAYPDNSYIMVAECMSDNTDDMGPRFSNYTSRFYDQVFAWQDIVDTDNDDMRVFWLACYGAIANANEALQSIEEMGGATTQTLREAKAEALLCRAYGHFLLVNMFSLNYNKATSSTDLGVTYMTEPETTVNPSYERNSVADVYDKIDKDIQEALPMVGDTHLDVPKYHFNRQAAYAFATRFYLFYEQWDKAVQYATECLGTNPSSMLRDWDEMESYGITDDLTPRTNQYINSSDNSNLMLSTAISMMGYWNSNYSYMSKYSHDSYMSTTETLEATNIWGGSRLMRCQPLRFIGGTLNRVLVAKSPCLFEYTDTQNQTGFVRSVYPPFKADLVLLERAEAYIMLGEYEKACADMTLWMQNWTTSTMTLTPENVTSFYNSMSYWTWDNPTLKKKLHPAFTIDADGSTQESMLQCVLNFKRLENIAEGLRWFDIKRYGITVYRRTMNASDEPESISDSLPANDLRRAIQLPSQIIQAGMQANPR